MKNKTNKNKQDIITKAVIWARVSSREQEEFGHSLPAQVNRLEEYCTRKNLTAIKTYIIAESSTRGEREEFYEMLKFLKKQKESIALVVDKVDRLQRSFKEYNELNELIENEKIEIHFNTESIVISKNSNAQAKLMWNMGIMFAQAYTDNLSDNVLRSNNKLRNDGLWLSKAPVGYKNIKVENKSQIILDPDQHFIVTKLFEEFSTGTFNLEEITRKAQALGLKPGTSKKVPKQSVRNMLSNTFYCGHMVCKGKSYGHNYKHLIDQKTFDKCQEILTGRINHKINTHEHLFKGIVTCKICGSPAFTDINVHPSKKKQEKTVYKYVYCRQCGGTRANENKGIAEIKTALGMLKKLPIGIVEKMIACIGDLINKEHKFEIEDKERVERQILAYETQKDRLLDLHLIGSITPDIYHKKLREIEQERQRLEEKLEDYSQITRQGFITLKYLATLAFKANDIWDFLTNDKKRTILKLMFTEILIEGGSLCFSIRKPILELAKMGQSQVWLG